MDKTERDEVRRLAADFRQWGRRAADIQGWHRSVRDAAADDEEALRSRSVVVDRAGRAAWRVVPLGTRDTAAVARLWERALLPVPDPGQLALLRLLTEEAPPAVEKVAPLLGLRRFFAGTATRERAATAVEFLRRQHAAVVGYDGLPQLEELGAATAPVPPGGHGIDALLDPALRFDLVAERTGPAPALLDRAVFADLPQALQTIDKVVASETSYRTAARQAGEQVRRTEAERILRGLPVEALRDATGHRLRLGPLTRAGINTVQQVLDNGPRLQGLAGVGATSARRMLGAAQALRKTTYDETPVRIDVTRRPPETTRLLRRLAEWDASRQTRGAAEDLERAAELAPLRSALRGDTSHLLVIPTRQLAAAGLRESIEIVKRRAELLRTSTAPGRGSLRADPWDDFLARPADYFALLAELGFGTEDKEKLSGDLPEEIIAAVRDQPLSGEYLTASLRGYQSFAARFALVQRKVILGDEMGLGKTVEALAVLAHLRSRGATHFLVVCPAAVVTNWVREVTDKSKLVAHRLHGTERDRAAREWIRDGGVAVTTYETLGWWETALGDFRDLACVVVDEAHYIKNPQARRTVRTKALIAGTDRAVLLTGTPLENRVGEFRNLASYLRPGLAVDATELSPLTFRRQIAPLYLRRNQEDVLTELPELIEVQEWIPMTAADAGRYRAAVERGNFMAMRQAAMLLGADSAKMRRLVEIVREAAENERRVVVFSHFRAVLDLVAAVLPEPVFGPLTGSVPAGQRQRTVDQFSAAEHGAVLVAQIVAGGVGLNIQSASVVVICEPQLKPTTEAQAIARAHRMGQVRSVQVHRLLSEESVDEQLMVLLAGKRRIFDDFARVSDLAAATPEAVDLSEAELVREVLAAERQRLFAGSVER